MANPRLNERDRRGTKIATTGANQTTIARLVPDKKSAVYAMFIKAVGVRLTGSGGALPAAFVYWRYAVFQTDSAGTVTQIGTTETIGTDKETDAGASIVVITDGTNVDVQVSAAYAANWTCNVETLEVDQVLV